MANLEVRNIPDDLLERLRRHAREHKLAVSVVVVGALEREMAHADWRRRLAQRPLTDLGVDAAALLAVERASRDAESGLIR